MNKKGQTDIVGNIISTIPKPIIFLFFILLLSFIVLLLSPVFNAFGVFCDSDKNVLKLHDSNVISNIALLTKLPDAEEIAGDNIDPDKYFFNFVKCTEYHNGTQRFLSFGKCHTCTIIEGLSSEIDRTADLCLGDAYRTADVNLSWWGRKVFCPLTDCRIPEGYYFEVDEGEYKCIGDCSSQTIANLRDSKLKELGSQPMYADNLDSNRFEGFFRFVCTDSLRVEPSIKGIPVFRLEYWAIGTLIILMLIAVMKFGTKK